MTTHTAHAPTQYARIFWPAMALLGLAALALRAVWLNSFPMSADEGIHLMWLRLLSAGYQPYSEVYITYPPLYPAAIQAVWSLWPTEAAQRWFSVAYTLFGATGVALLARKFAGPVAGLAAAAFTLFSPFLMEHSRAVLGEFPSVAWAVWAVWLAWLYTGGGPKARLWLGLSAICMAASLLTKLLAPFVLALIPIIIAARWYGLKISRYKLTLTGAASAKKWQTLAADLALWSLVLLLPILIMAAIFDLGPLVNQVFDQRVKAWASYSTGQPYWTARLELAGTFIRQDFALATAGILGLMAAISQRRPNAWIMAGWLLLAVAMLLVHNPVWEKHFLILIPPLAVFGGAAVAFWLARLQQPHRHNERLTAGAGLLLLMGLGVWQSALAVSGWQTKAAIPQPPADEAQALAFIDSITAPTDCLITDDMPLVYWSGRMVPPELAEVSGNRLQSGALTLPELIALTDRYDCQVVAAVSNRIPKYLPDYMRWVKSKYLGSFKYGDDELFFAKSDTDPDPATPLWANFNHQIIFHGYSLPQTPVHPGQRLPLTLVWQAQNRPPVDYTIFVQLRNPANTTLASADHSPYKGLLPTSSWPAGAVIQEMTWLTLPPDIPPGNYALYVGLYRPDTQERLPLLDDASGENALILGPVQVTGSR